MICLVCSACRGSPNQPQCSVYSLVEPEVYLGRHAFRGPWSLPCPIHSQQQLKQPNLQRRPPTNGTLGGVSGDAFVVSSRVSMISKLGRPFPMPKETYRALRVGNSSGYGGAVGHPSASCLTCLSMERMTIKSAVQLLFSKA